MPNLKLEINYEEKGWELCPRDHLQFLSLLDSVIYMWVIIYDISAKNREEMIQLYSIHYQKKKKKVLKSHAHTGTIANLNPED